MKWWLIVLFLVVLVVGLGWWVWRYTGLNKYVDAMQAINALPLEQQGKAKGDFVGSEDSYLYGGILAGVTGDNVWIWGRRGLHYFKTDEYSVYSYFSMCNDEILRAFANNEKVVIDRSVDTDLTSWRQKAKTGQFVVIMITNPENGGTLGNLREMKAHDWWAFLPTNIGKLCEK